MLTASPVLTGIHLQGSFCAITSVVLSFDESLDSTTAQDLQSYHSESSVDPGSNDGGGFDWTATPGSPLAAATTEVAHQWSGSVHVRHLR